MVLTFLNNIIPGEPLSEKVGMNERLAELKPGFLLSAISKTLHLMVNPAS
jgi:hypothetical protein